MCPSRNEGMTRNEDRVVLHFDYDCFYAAVFEAENPALHSLPLAVQQKHIIVTCNYEARRRGLRKLQLITEAKRICPDLIIVLGEDLTRFRNASKMLFDYLRSYAWGKRAERLGFAEVFLDVTDMVQYNVELLNRSDPANSFFHLSREDPTVGFSFDASKVAGYTWPLSTDAPPLLFEHRSARAAADARGLPLFARLLVGSHLAQHLRHKLEEDKGYTSTVGVSTAKLLSKLVGNVHKPKAQTTLLPPFDGNSDYDSVLAASCSTFIGEHEVGKIPGIGFKFALQIRNFLLGHAATSEPGLLYGTSRESVRVSQVRSFPRMGPELLDMILGGSGAPQDIGVRVWGLLNAIDNTEVLMARKVPRQISIEDSYIRLDGMEQVRTELTLLSKSLLHRMHADLLEEDDQSRSDDTPEHMRAASGNDKTHMRTPTQRWIAFPRTLRLSTRPRPPPNADGSRARSFQRISRSGPLPRFVFSLTHSRDAIVERLVNEALLPHFRRLHPDNRGWDLSLVNIAVTNMAEVATEGSEGPPGGERNIERMFKNQESVLQAWKVEDRDVAPGEMSYGPVPPRDVEEVESTPASLRSNSVNTEVGLESRALAFATGESVKVEKTSWSTSSHR